MTERLSDKFANDLPSDIRLDSGVTHVVVVDTDQYSGGFERELGAYVFGAFDEYCGEREMRAFNAAMEADPRLLDILDKVISVSHSEYDDVSTTIWATPGWLNLGRGIVTDDGTLGPGDVAYPAYESVGVFLDDPLTEEQLAIVTARAHEFATTGRSRGGQPVNLTIKAIRQLSFEVTRTVTVRKV